jgi:cobalt-zinc-cadmium efflux system outer membrane protein
MRSFGIALCCFIIAGPVDASPTDGTLPPAQPDHQVPSDSSLPIVEEPTGVLVLSQALALALTQNPELSAYSWESRAQEAATLQAGLLPNPTFNANASNFGNRVLQG